MSYPTIGAEMIANEYGGPLNVAEALLLGKLSKYDQKFVHQIVTPIILEAARIRIAFRMQEQYKLEILNAIESGNRSTTQLQHPQSSVPILEILPE